MKSSRRSEVDPFIVMDVMEAARAAEAAGRHIIHMEVGQPGTPAPEGARAALLDAMTAGNTLGYTVALGLPDAARRDRAMYGERHDVDLDPARVIVTSGSSGAFILAFTALFDTGTRVGIGAPGLPVVSPDPARAGPDAGGHPDRAGAPVPADARRRAAVRARRACWSHRRRTRPARCSTGRRSAR